MATLSAADRLEFETDLRAVATNVRQGVTRRRAQAQDSHWDVWTAFCERYELDPFLLDKDDPVPYLQLFLQRYRDGRAALAGQPVRARTAEDAIRQISQTMALLGARDPRLSVDGRMDVRITRQLAAWKRQDTPARRKQPVPRVVLDDLTDSAWASQRVHHQVGSDLLWIGVYWLLRPSEYLRTSHPDRRPFRLKDISFGTHDGRTYEATTIPLTIIPNATRASVYFELQKNGVAGENIWASRTNDAHRCPVQALGRRILHLRQHYAPPTTPKDTSFLLPTSK